jgi:hypothetical protein
MQQTHQVCAVGASSDNTSVRPALKLADVFAHVQWASAAVCSAGPFHELGAKVVGEPAGSRFSSKAFLHRHAASPEVPSVIEQTDQEIQVKLATCIASFALIWVGNAAAAAAAAAAANCTAPLARSAVDRHGQVA